MNIDWKWLIIGFVLAWFVVPFVQARMARKKPVVNAA